MGVLRSALLAMSRNRWLGKKLPNSAAGRRAARKFMPGERLQDAIAAGKRLRAEGITVVLTELGEDITDAADAQRAAQGYEAALEALSAAGLAAATLPFVGLHGWLDWLAVGRLGSLAFRFSRSGLNCQLKGR